MKIEQAEALELICYYAKEHLKDDKIMSQSIDIAKDIIKKALKENEQYKTLEEELGIDLVTLFKALKGNEFYSKHPETGEVSWIVLPELYYCSRKWNIGCGSMIFNEQEKCCDSWDCDPKDHGKTWALTKEELEK